MYAYNFFFTLAIISRTVTVDWESFEGVPENQFLFPEP